VKTRMEKEWMDAYRAWEADRGFLRARRRALAARLGAFLSKRRRTPAGDVPCPGDAGMRDIAVRSVVGVLEQGVGRPLLPPSRACLSAWRRHFTVDDVDMPPIRVTCATGGWLLLDAADALLVQALQARGVRTMVVRAPTPSPVTAHSCDPACPCDLTREIA